MYQVTTHDGRVYDLAQEDPNRIKELAKRLELIPVRLTNGDVEYLSKGTVARISRRRRTQSWAGHEQLQLERRIRGRTEIALTKADFEKMRRRIFGGKRKPKTDS